MKIEILLCFFFLLLVNQSYGKETHIVIRAKAKDAKFIGSSIGGAYVMVKSKMTGEIMAQGKTEGSTGNTDLIMNTPWKRGVSLTDESTAKFLATIDIDEPTFVTIEVQSPISNKQAMVQASTEIWLIPGKDILGDGIVVEIPGFVLDILEPRTHQYVSLASVADKTFTVQANLVMMCGCTISKGGIWDSERIEVSAIIKRNGDHFLDVPLGLVSENLFETSFKVENPGQYEVVVYAYDEMTGNTGVDKVNFIIRD